MYNVNDIISVEKEGTHISKHKSIKQYNTQKTKIW